MEARIKDGGAMDPILLQAFQARYQEVAKVEEAEQQRASTQDRWRKLNAIYQLAVSIGVDLRAEGEDDAVVWRCWARLKDPQA